MRLAAAGFRLHRASGAGHCVGYDTLEGLEERRTSAVTVEAVEAVVLSSRLLEAEMRVHARRARQGRPPCSRTARPRPPWAV